MFTNTNNQNYRVNNSPSSCFWNRIFRIVMASFPERNSSTESTTMWLEVRKFFFDCVVKSVNDVVVWTFCFKPCSWRNELSAILFCFLTFKPMVLWLVVEPCDGVRWKLESSPSSSDSSSLHIAPSSHSNATLCFWVSSYTKYIHNKFVEKVSTYLVNVFWHFRSTSRTN